jgi:hypothetical protein
MAIGGDSVTPAAVHDAQQAEADQDEIERLEAELLFVKDQMVALQQINTTDKAEIEGLKTENKKLWHDYKSRSGAAVERQAENEKLKAENEKLKADRAGDQHRLFHYERLLTEDKDKRAGWEVEGFINRLTEAISHLRAFSRDCDGLRAENERLRARIEPPEPEVCPHCGCGPDYPHLESCPTGMMQRQHGYEEKDGDA